MPKPQPRPQQLNMDDRPRRMTGASRMMESRSECAIQIAAICSEWSYLEQGLANMFAMAMGPAEITESGVVTTGRDWPSLVAMREVHSIHQRLNIIENTLIELLSDCLKREWKNLKREITSAAPERNKVAHGLWWIAKEYPQDLLLEEKKGHITRYTEEDFRNIFEWLWNIRLEVHTFLKTVQAERAQVGSSIGGYHETLGILAQRSAHD